MQAESVSVTDLVIYFGAWALLFSLASILEGKRTIYLFALYFSLIGFDIAWRQSVGREAWAAASTFQFIQFVLFAATATWFSIVHRAPMNETEAFLHGGALLYFYVAIYIALKQNVPLPGVPGVTDDEISVAVITAGTNPLAGDFRRFADGVEALLATSTRMQAAANQRYERERIKLRRHRDRRRRCSPPRRRDRRDARAQLASPATSARPALTRSGWSAGGSPTGAG